MNESAIQHIPETKYCFAVEKNRVKIRLRISRNDRPDEIEVIYGSKYLFASRRSSVKMSRSYEDRLFAWYTAELILSDVRLVYVFRLKDKDKTFYFSEDGLTGTYDYSLNYYNCFQYAYINEADIHKSVDWMDNACFYQIFVERFCKGDDKKDLSYINLKWGEKPTPKSFAGGDLKGIYDNLDYISGLGINAIYLTPIFKSVSNHKYDISDYYAIDEQFGNGDIFKKLVSAAHSRGMKIVIDAVFNHCSENITQFQDVLKNGKKSKYYDWFIITNDRPLEYECFASCRYMPKFNTSNAEVQNFLIGVATYWIKEYGVDGWRLDVSDEVSHDFWRAFRKAVKEVKQDCVIIGENWHDANNYLRGDEFDGIMNYAFTKACLDFYAFGVFGPDQFADKLNELLMRNSDTVNRMMLNLLDSHDTHRFLTCVKGDEDKLKSALALNFFFVGAPCVYYGTENAMLGGYDPDSRRTFDWETAKKETGLKRLIKSLTALKSGGRLSGTEIKIFEKEGLLIVERSKLRLVINESGYERDYSAANEIFSNKFNGTHLKNGGFIIEITK